MNTLHGFEINDIRENEATVTVYSPYSDNYQVVTLKFDEGPSIAQPVAYFHNGMRLYKPTGIRQWVKLYTQHALEKILSGAPLAKKYAVIPNAITDPDAYAAWKEEQEARRGRRLRIA